MSKPTGRPPGRPQTYVIEPGQRFGRGVVIEEVRLPKGSRPGGVRGARLKCDCGTVYEAWAVSLVKGGTLSCGCLKREQITAYSQSPEGKAALTRAQQSHVTHGLARKGSPQRLMYDTWKNMMARCYNPEHPEYPRYGARGIKVCDRWQDPQLFIADISQLLGPRPDGMSLDRWPDNDGNYEPGNVRWATPLEQTRNSRKCLP